MLTLCRVFGKAVSVARYLQQFSGPGLIAASAESVRCTPDALLPSSLISSAANSASASGCQTHPCQQTSFLEFRGSDTRLKDYISNRVLSQTPAGLWHMGEPQKECRELADARGWQALGTVKLPDGSVLEPYIHKGLVRAAGLAEGPRTAPDGERRGAVSAGP